MSKRNKGRKDCYGCIHLEARPDAAGGGTYHCALLHPCIVIGEWGHWTNVRDGPKEIDSCWEKVERQLRVLNGGKRG
jgi:hypothetical protein